MFKLFKASLYKLFREKTFLITMIIGTGLAILLPLLYKLLDLVSGQTMLFASVAPGSNFGLTVPINLSVLIVAEFTTGTLRNKIIAGYRKSLIYLSLLLSGIIFTLIMMVYYVGLSVLMGTILGGFDATAVGGADVIVPFIFITITSYILVASFSTLIASNIRNIGGSLPILIVVLTFLSLIPLFTEISAFSMSEEEFNRLFVTLSWTVPMFTLNSLSGAIGGATAPEQELWNQMKIAGIISPLIYSAIFVTLGTIFFKIRDVK